MSAEIIPFVPKARRERGINFALAASCSPWRLDDLAMDHADTAPSEYVPMREHPDKDEPA